MSAFDLTHHPPKKNSPINLNIKKLENKKKKYSKQNGEILWYNKAYICPHHSQEIIQCIISLDPPIKIPKKKSPKNKTKEIS